MSLTPLDPVTAQLVWACQGRAAQPLPRPWPEARELLAAQQLSGALLGARGACSYWQGGKLLGGVLPERGEQLSVILLGTGGMGPSVADPPVAQSPSVAGTGNPAPLEAAELLTFWSGMLRVLEQALGAAGAGSLDAHWRAAASVLADAHPCLDPFAREVWWTSPGGVQAHPDVTLEELRPALLDVYRSLLQRSELNPRVLPLSELRQQRAWVLAGLQPATPSGLQDTLQDAAARPLAP